MTPDLISQCTGAVMSLARKYADDLIAAMAEFTIDTPVRQAAFLAQVGHESGGLQWMRELWGPTQQQSKYEPPGTLAAVLGNTQKGDGHLFSGRGPIQITGRANYRVIGRKLGLDLEAHPEYLDDPLNACRSAGAFWVMKGLNQLADKADFETITRRINGGANGLADRMQRWERAKLALNVNISND